VLVEADCPCAPRQVSVTRWEPADEYVCLIGPVAPEIFADVPSPKSTWPEPLSQDALIRVTPCDWITSRFPEPPEDPEEPIAIAVLPAWPGCPGCPGCPGSPGCPGCPGCPGWPDWPG
jgi:hypothetical protein